MVFLEELGERVLKARLECAGRRWARSSQTGEGPQCPGLFAALGNSGEPHA